MFSYELQVAYFPVKQSSLYNNMEYPTCHFYFLGIHTSLRTQTYFRLSLVSAENNVCKPEPGNDFCNVMTFVSPWPIRFHDKMKLECSSQRIPRAVVLGLLELNCDWLKIPPSEKSFPGLGSQTLFFGGDERQPEIRLHLQASEFQTSGSTSQPWLESHIILEKTL